MKKCDLYDLDCRGQGCTQDPLNCDRVRDEERRARRIREAETDATREDQRLACAIAEASDVLGNRSARVIAFYAES